MSDFPKCLDCGADEGTLQKEAMESGGEDFSYDELADMTEVCACCGSARLVLGDYEKLEWIHSAIQEAMRGNLGELEQAIELVEELREPYLQEGAE